MLFNPALDKRPGISQKLWQNREISSAKHSFVGRFMGWFKQQPRIIQIRIVKAIGIGTVMAFWLAYTNLVINFASEDVGDFEMNDPMISSVLSNETDQSANVPIVFDSAIDGQAAQVITQIVTQVPQTEAVDFAQYLASISVEIQTAYDNRDFSEYTRLNLELARAYLDQGLYWPAYNKAQEATRFCIYNRAALELIVNEIAPQIEIPADQMAEHLQMLEIGETLTCPEA